MSGGSPSLRQVAFATTYAAFAHLAERASLAPLRAQTLAAARGRLLVLGAGQGHDLVHLPAAVTEVIALEPDAAMRQRGRQRVRGTAVPAGYLGGTAEALPLASESIDTVLAALVLCSVQDLTAAVHELARVLRPDGLLLLLEHVAAPAESQVTRWQRRADRFWSPLAGGCHLDRDTRAALEQAGFDLSEVRDRHLARALPLLDPAIQGVARLLPRTGAASTDAVV